MWPHLAKNKNSDFDVLRHVASWTDQAGRKMAGVMRSGSSELSVFDIWNIQHVTP